MKIQAWRMMMLLGVALGLVPSGRLWAQATQAESLERGPGFVSEKITARARAEDLLKSKGWAEGLNKNKTGEDVYVTIASGDIQAPLDHPNYLDSRVNAYDKAMLAAWGQIRKLVGESIKAHASSYYKESDGQMAAGTAPTVTNKKIAMLMNATFDKVLKKAGVDPASATQEEKEKALSSEMFTKSVTTLASGPVAGVQSYATFEGPGGGNGYQIVVVAIWSERLQQLAESMVCRTKAPEGTPEKPVKEWIPKEMLQLICTFGVQMIQDEKGQPVLLAYGQSHPISESSRSMDAAYAKAFLEAKSQLRFFAGAQAQVLDTLFKQESTDEYSDATKEYNSANAFSQHVEVYAPAEKFAGIQQIKTWSYIHPLTKKPMAGVVAMWSPENALVASRLGAEIAGQGKKPSLPNLSTTMPNKRESLDKSNQGLNSQGTRGSDGF